MIGFNVCYSEGAPGFCTNNAVFTLYNNSNSVGVGWIADGVFANGTQIELTKVWSALAGYEHIWNPKWRTSVVRRLRQRRLQRQCDRPDPAAHCLAWRRDAAVAAIAPALSTIQPLGRATAAAPTTSFWEAGTRTQWNPVPQLDIGLRSALLQAQHRLQRPRHRARVAARGPPCLTSSTTRTSGPRCSAGSATSIHDRLSDPGKLPTPGGKPPGVLFCPTERPVARRASRARP